MTQCQDNEKLSLNTLLDLSNVIDAPESDDKPPLPPMVLSEVIQHPDNLNADIDDDYAKIRQQAIHQLEMIDEVSRLAVEMVRNSESPKTIEIFSDLMFKQSVVKDKMVDIHKKIKEIKNMAKPPESTTNIQNQQNIQNNTYVTTTNDLLTKVGTRQDIIRKQKNEEDQE